MLVQSCRQLSALRVFTQVELDTELSDLEDSDFEEMVRGTQLPQGLSVGLQFVVSHSE